MFLQKLCPGCRGTQGYRRKVTGPYQSSSHTHRRNSFSIFVEQTSRELQIPPPQPQQTAGTKLLECKKQPRSPTDFTLSESEEEPPKRQFMWSGFPALPQPDGEGDQLRQTFGDYIKGTLKNATKRSARGLKRVWTTVGAMSWINLLKKPRLPRGT